MRPAGSGLKVRRRARKKTTMDALCEELNALCREQLSGITIARVGDRLLREKGGAK